MFDQTTRAPAGHELNVTESDLDFSAITACSWEEERNGR